MNGSWTDAQSWLDIIDQVVNGHKSPMRSDLDLVIKKIDQLREELSKEEASRREGIGDLREELDRKFSDLLQRFIDKNWR